MGKLLRRIYYWLHHRQAFAELAEEIEAHRLMRQARLEQSGLSKQDASLTSKRAMGNTLLAAEHAREIWSWRWLDGLIQDLVYASRQIRRAPVLTLFIVLTVGIPITAITTGLSIFNAEMFGFTTDDSGRPLVARPGEIRQILWHTDYRPGFFAGPGYREFPYAVYEHFRKNATSFADLICINEEWSTVYNPENLAKGGAVEQNAALFVSGNAFRAMGIATIIGRPIIPGDDHPAAPPVVVVSHGFWQRVLGGDEAALGKTLYMNRQPFVVIGVTPERSHIDPIHSAADLTIPIAHRARTMKRPDTFCRMVGRLRPGVDSERARAESEVLARQMNMRFEGQVRPAGEASKEKTLIGLRGFGTRIDESNFRDLLASLPAILSGLAVVAAVLLIACSNIAGLLLAQTTARSGEIATRLALGASRRRIIRQLLTESVLIASAGGTLGTLAAFVVRKIMLTRGFPVFVLDVRVLFLTAGLTVFIGILFGLAPAWIATRIDLLALTKQAASGIVGRTSFRTGKVLTGLQLALTFPLLVSASLHTQIFLALLSPGDFEPERALLFNVVPAGMTLEGFLQPVVRDIEGIAGVVSVSAMQQTRETVCLPQLPRFQAGTVAVVRVAPGFFDTMKVALLRGRDLNWNDLQEVANVAIVNEAFVRDFSPAGNPLEGRIGLQGPDCSDDIRIVGVVPTWSNVLTAASLEVEPGPTVFLPWKPGQPFLTFVVRSAGNAAPFIPLIEQTMKAFDPTMPNVRAQTFESFMELNARSRRRVAGVFITLALATLVQAMVGIYGILSYFVSRRASEVGLRIALGAQRRDVIRMVMRQSLVPVGVGIAVGLLAVPLVLRLMTAEISLAMGEMTAWTAMRIVGIAAILIATAVAAASGPARAASRIDPMRVLRRE